MVNLNWQLDWIYNHHGNPPVGVSVIVFPERFHRNGKTVTEWGEPHTMGWGPRWHKREKVNRDSAIVPLCFLQMQHDSHFMFLSSLPWWTPSLNPEAKTNSLLKSLPLLHCFCGNEKRSWDNNLVSLWGFWVSTRVSEENVTYWMLSASQWEMSRLTDSAWTDIWGDT